MQENEKQLEFQRKQQAKRLFSCLGFGLVVLLAAHEGAQYILRYAAVQLAPSVIEQGWFYWALSFVPLYGVGLPALLWALRAVPPAPHRNEDEQGTVPAFRAKWWFLILLVALGYMYIGSWIGESLMSDLSHLTGRDYQNSLATLVEETPLWMTVLGTVVLAPIGEEFLFRKVFVDRMRVYGDATAIVMSALFFALFHRNLYQFFYALLIGLLLGYLYTRTGKLWLSIALHMSVNALGGVIMPWVYEQLDLAAMTEAELMTSPLAILLSVLIYGVQIAAVVLTIVMRKRIVLKKSQVPVSRDSLVVAAWCAPGVVVAIALCVFTVLGNLLL